MIRHYRRDGSPYPPGDEGLFEWAHDFENPELKRVAYTVLEDGKVVSTVWLGLDHGFGGPPLIFETMVFSETREPIAFGGWVDLYSRDLDMERYSTEAEAQAGHEAMVKKWTEIVRLDKSVQEEKPPEGPNSSGKT